MMPMSTYNDEFRAKHKNDPKVWRLHDGTEVSTAALKRLYSGLGLKRSLPSPAMRMLLGITKIHESK